MTMSQNVFSALFLNTHISAVFLLLQNVRIGTALDCVHSLAVLLQTVRLLSQKCSLQRHYNNENFARAKDPIDLSAKYILRQKCRNGALSKRLVFFCPIFAHSWGAGIFAPYARKRVIQVFWCLDFFIFV